MYTRRIFDGVIVTILVAHLAFGLPRMWARRVARQDQGPSAVAASAVLHATS